MKKDTEVKLSKAQKATVERMRSGYIEVDKGTSPPYRFMARPIDLTTDYVLNNNSMKTLLQLGLIEVISNGSIKNGTVILTNLGKSINLSK